MNDHPLIASLKQLQYDLSVMRTRVAEIQRQVATLSLVAATQYPCPECLIPFPSALKRDEHLYRIHDGPTPTQWLKEEADTVVPASALRPPIKEGVPKE